MNAPRSDRDNYKHFFVVATNGQRNRRSMDEDQLQCLEAEDLVLKLADRSGLLVAETLGSLLHGGDHGRRSADKHLHVG
jgi:hypothetical protein